MLSYEMFNVLFCKERRNLVVDESSVVFDGFELVVVVRFGFGCDYLVVVVVGFVGVEFDGGVDEDVGNIIDFDFGVDGGEGSFVLVER